MSGGAAGVLSGGVGLRGDSAVEFASGQITSLAANAQLQLRASDAFIEDSTALGSSSALTGLDSIGAGATLMLHYNAVSTIGSLTNSGFISLDYPYMGAGGSTLSIGGALTNTGTLNIGNSGLSSSDSVTANSFVNSGTVGLTGAGTNFAALNVAGTLTNNGSISIASDTETLAGKVSGTGPFSLSTANLQFDSSVSPGQTITETGADGLTLKLAQDFAGTISGFGTGDTIDATNFLETATSYNFVENIAGTGGTLTLHDASLTANILMTGDYSKSSFTLAHDSGTGTLVKNSALRDGLLGL
jgi:Hyphally regulated cell wall protein N-terminal